MHAHAKAPEKDASCSIENGIVEHEQRRLRSVSAIPPTSSSDGADGSRQLGLGVSNRHIDPELKKAMQFQEPSQLNVASSEREDYDMAPIAEVADASGSESRINHTNNQEHPTAATNRNESPRKSPTVPTVFQPPALSTLSENPKFDSKVNAYRVVLRANEKLTFIGSMDVALEAGDISIYCSKISRKPSQPLNFHQIHSPIYTPLSLMQINADKDSSIFIRTSTSLSALPDVEEDQKTLIGISQPDAKKRQQWITTLEIRNCYFIKQQTIEFYNRFPLAAINVSSVWKNTLQTLEDAATAKRDPKESFIVCICGTRNVGKSTFTRLLINSLLNKKKSLCLIDTDVGQSEFTPPGIVSLHVIKSPIFGPPHTHLQPPSAARLVGHLTISDDPQQYIDNISSLLHTYRKSYSTLPLIINTQGWMTGLGLEVLKHLFQLSRPSHVVFLHEPHIDSSADAPSSNENTILTDRILSDATFPYQLYTHKGCQFDVPQPLVSKSTTHLSAERTRALAFVSYFTQNLSNITFTSLSKNICSQKPHEISFSSVAITALYQDLNPSLTLQALNASLVAIASVKGDKIKKTTVQTFDKFGLRVCRSELSINSNVLGYGIVRAIDIQKKLFYIITPLSDHQLSHANVLIRPSIELPNIFYLSPILDAGNVPAESPYLLHGAVAIGSNVGGGDMKSRTNMARKRLRSP